MNLPPSPRRLAAMTLIELVVLVVLIGILVSLIMPIHGGSGRKKHSKHFQALTDMADLRGAVQVFRDEYGYLPVSEHTASLTNKDFTCGTFHTSSGGGIGNRSGPDANNAEIVRILSMLPAPEGNAQEPDPLKRNPRRTVYFNARPAGESRSPGIGTDGVFRDPWGSPYILTFDLDGDGVCTDPLYGPVASNRQFGQMFRALPPDQGTNGWRKLPPASVIIWSFGPDGQANVRERTNAGVNLDNIISWR